MLRIGFIGSGKMAGALIKAILKAKISDKNHIIASDVSGERLDYIKKETGIRVSKSNMEVVVNSDVIILAVKPQNMGDVLDDIKEGISEKHLVISIAAGITLRYLESKLKEARVIRVMPNTPCLVGEMAAGFALGSKVKDKDMRIVEEILNSAGKAFYLKEELLDAVTGLSGSGPAFIAYLLEGLIEGGVKSGLSRDVAGELAMQTCLGTAKLLMERGLSTKELIDMVSSPGGTTIAGRNVLENSDVKKILVKTIEEATKRSKELGKKCS